MNIHKSHSKNDLIDLINLIELKVVFSHQDNKKDIQEKILEVLKSNIEIKDNYYNIQNKEGLKIFLANKNPKKSLTIKEKNPNIVIMISDAPSRTKLYKRIVEKTGWTINKTYRSSTRP